MLKIKKLLTILFFLFSIKGFAQKGFWLGLTSSPEISNQNLIGNKTYPTLAQTSGILVIYDLNKRLGLTSGVWYSTKSFHEIYDRRDQNGVYYKDVKKFQSINYIEIPLLLNIKFGDSCKVGFYSSVGPVFGLPVSAYWKDKPNIGYNQSVYSNIMNPILSAYLGIGASVKFSKKTLLIIEPNVKRSLTPIYNSNSDMKDVKYFYSFGIRFGFIYKL
jgi:hypothetical protein